jgi:hypothetical protein
MFLLVVIWDILGPVAFAAGLFCAIEKPPTFFNVRGLPTNYNPIIYSLSPRAPRISATSGGSLTFTSRPAQSFSVFLNASQST